MLVKIDCVIWSVHDMPDDRVGWPLLQTIKGGSHKKTGFHRKSSEILPNNLPKSL